MTRPPDTHEIAPAAYAAILFALVAAAALVAAIWYCWR